MTITCHECGTDFTPPKTRSSHRRKYCTPRCASRSYRKAIGNEHRNAYARKRYRENPAAREKILQAGREGRALLHWLKSQPCADCGGAFHPVAMDFDHLHGKTRGISMMLTYSMERLQEELAKCEVVCSNCHRVRTYERKMARRGGVGSSNVV